MSSPLVLFFCFVVLAAMIGGSTLFNFFYARNFAEKRISEEVLAYDLHHRPDARLCHAAELALCATPGECQRIECFKFRGVSMPRCELLPDPALDGTACDDDDPDTVSSTCDRGVCAGTATAAPTAQPTASPTPVPADAIRACNASEIAACGPIISCVEYDCRVIGEQTGELLCTPLANLTADGELCDDGSPYTNVSVCFGGACRSDVARLCTPTEVSANCASLSPASACTQIGCIVLPSGAAFCADHTNASANNVACDYDGGYLDYVPASKCYNGQCVPLQTTPCDPDARESPITLFAGNSVSAALFNNTGRAVSWGSTTVNGYGIGQTSGAAISTLPYVFGYLPFRNGSAGADYVVVNKIAYGISVQCALLNNSRVICWGSGAGPIGQAGALTAATGVVPYPNLYDIPYVRVAVDANGTQLLVKDLILSPSASHVCAIMAVNDKIRCWGTASSGQLGVGALAGPIGDNEYPDSLNATFVQLPTASQAATSVALGGAFTCAITTPGPAVELYCWGSGANGVLGYGDLTTRTSPAATAVNLTTNGDYARQVAASTLAVCVLTEIFRDVKCWGSGSSGVLGTNATTNLGDTPSTIPANNAPVEGIVSPSDYASGVRVDSICAGGSHFCAFLNNSEIKCWGSNTNGRLGYGIATATTSIGSSSALSLQSVGYALVLSELEKSMGISVVQLVCGATHNCVRLSNGQVKCWGEGGLGALGYGDGNDRGGGNVTNTIDRYGYVRFRPIENTDLDLACSCMCVQQNTSDAQILGDFLVDTTGVECPANPTLVGATYCPSPTFADPRCVCDSVIRTPAPTRVPTPVPTAP